MLVHTITIQINGNITDEEGDDLSDGNVFDQIIDAAESINFADLIKQKISDAGIDRDINVEIIT